MSMMINPHRFGGGGPTDPDFANVRLLLSARNGNIEDLCSFPASLTVNGDPVAVSDQGPFADNRSIRINDAGSSGNADFIACSLFHSSNLAQLFTIEAWVRRRGQPNSFMGWLGDGQRQFGHETGGSFLAYFFLNFTLAARSDAALSTDTWYLSH